MSAANIALIGDYSPEVVAHRAIPLALAEAGAGLGNQVRWHWIASRDLKEPEADLADYSAVWAVPGSPYANMQGMLDAIGWSRSVGKPFLGTCGGFQHALIEFARSVAGISDADHAESNPEGRSLVVSPLSCSLAGKTGVVTIEADSHLSGAYGANATTEAYHCNYGVNRAYRTRLEAAGLRFTAFDSEGEVRALELPGHPFFVGTLFQPERAALEQRPAPLVRAFVRAASA